MVAVLAVGLVFAPVAAVAATVGVVKLTGDGVTATVTGAGQLDTAKVAPSALRAFHYADLVGTGCHAIYVAPKGWSLVLQEVTVDVTVDGTPGPGINVRLATDPACHRQFADDNPPSVGPSSFAVTPGIVVSPGRGLYGIADNGVSAEVYGYGYVVPSADAPTPTPAQPGAAHGPGDRNRAAR